MIARYTRAVIERPSLIARLWPLLLVAIWVILDQALKAYVVANISPFQSTPQSVISGVISLVHTTNKGAAWSLFSGGTLLLTLLRFVVGAGILVYLWRNPRMMPVQRVAWALVIGGAFGNAIDGLFRGEVVDMLIWHQLDAVYRAIFHNPFPIFNIADSGVVVGVILLLISSFFPTRKAPVAAKVASGDANAVLDERLEPKDSTDLR